MNVQHKRVLIIGDSLSAGAGTPGDYLAQALRAAGAADVRINARSGRSAYSFFAAEGGAGQLAQEAQLAPDTVIVMLGTNDLGLDMAVDGQLMARIRDAFAGADVWGIGPPELPGDSVATATVVSMMQGVFAQFIDWRPLTADMISTASGRSPDLVHFQPSGAQIAAQRLAAALLVPVMPVIVKVGVIALALAAVGTGIWALSKKRRP